MTPWLPHFVLMKETVYGLRVLNPSTWQRGNTKPFSDHETQRHLFVEKRFFENKHISLVLYVHETKDWEAEDHLNRPFHKSTCEMFISIEGFWPLCDSMIVIRFEHILNDILGCYRPTLGGMLWSLKVISVMLTDMTWLQREGWFHAVSAEGIYAKRFTWLVEQLSSTHVS
jgi:hypothetical protein